MAILVPHIDFHDAAYRSISSAIDRMPPTRIFLTPTMILGWILIQQQKSKRKIDNKKQKNYKHQREMVMKWDWWSRQNYFYL